MPPNAKDCAKISHEIESWRAENIIDSRLANLLLERYSPHPSGSWHITAILTMGAVLVGVGILLFVGSNWNVLSATTKLCAAFGSMLAFYFYGWKFGFEPGKRPRLGSALMLTGTIIYGAAIWLTAQLFHMDLTIENGALLWGLGTLGIALATRSTAQCVLFALVAALWAGLCQESHWWGSASQQLPLLLRLLASLGASTSLSYFVRSKSGIAVGVGATSIALLGTGLAMNAPFVLLPFGICLFAFYLVLKNVWEPAARAFMYGGAANAIMGMLLMTFLKSYDETGATCTAQIALTVAATILTLTAARLRPRFRWEALGAAIVAVVPLAIYAIPVKSVAVFGLNAALILAVIGAIIAGQGRLKQPGLINMAIAGFVIEVLCRYFDFYFTMFDRSMAFTLGGLILLGAGAMVERGRRKLLERIA